MIVILTSFMGIGKMNQRQRENTAKYLYDLSKGITLIAVVGNIVTEKRNFTGLIIGFVGSLVLYLWALYIDKGEI